MLNIGIALTFDERQSEREDEMEVMEAFDDEQYERTIYSGG